MIDKKYLCYLLGSLHSPLILDVGCYNMADSIEFAELFPTAEIHAFDPHIVASTKPIPSNVKFHGIALSDNDTKKIMTCPTEHIQSSSIETPELHKDIFPRVVFNYTCEVTCKKLSTWYDENCRGKIIDLLWADVNGHEKALINGGIELFNRNIRYFYVEYSNVGLYSNHMSLWNLLDQFPNHELLYNEYYYGQEYGNALLKNLSIEG